MVIHLYSLKCTVRVNNLGSTNLSATIVGVLLAMPDLEQGFLPKDCLQSKERTIGTGLYNYIISSGRVYICIYG